MNRKILIITYHFPPSTVAASFRPLRLAKYLPDLGYRVWVIAATAGAYPLGRTDSELTKEIPSSVNVTRIPNPNPLLWYESRQTSERKANPEASNYEVSNSKFKIANIKSFLAEFAKFPDTDMPWATMALLPALSLVIRNHIEIIYTSAPPFGAHILGLMLKKITGKPWIAHYGNPWTANPSISWNCAAFKRRCDSLDRAIIHSADAVLTLDDILADCIRDLGREHGVYVQTNGFDPAHFNPTGIPNSKFTITYAGSLYNMHDPLVIYEALALIERDNPTARADMRIVFAGPPQSDPLRDGAPTDIEFTGPLGHSKLAQMLNDSHVLLDFLTAESGAKFTVSCKLYEYMAARRPILAVTPEGPMANEVRRLNLGKVTPCDDPNAIARAIMSFYKDYKAGTLRMPSNPGIDAYSAPSLVREFSRIVEEVCSEPGQEPTGSLRSVK